MSNIVAGDVFQKMIEDVCQASQNDFEENGVQAQALQELQQVWQHKLSQFGIAQMPWDPKPQPAPQAPTPQQAPVAQPAPPQNQQPGPPMQNHAPVNGQQGKNGGAPHIKPEPGNETPIQNMAPAPSYSPQGTNQMLAQQRAAQLLQAQFGSQANASLASMQQRGIALPGQQRPQGLQLPGGQNPHQVGQGQQGQQVQQGQQGQQGQQPTHQQQYAQQMRQQQQGQQTQVKLENGAENGQYQQPQSGQHIGLGYSQTDGAGDAMDEWASFMAQRRLLTAEDVAKNDHMMRDDVAQLIRNLDHGLMVPLDQRQRSGVKKRMSDKREPSCLKQSVQVMSSIPQLDGEADVKDEEEDEDAINSDLDSSDDEANKEEEDEDDMDSMLCTYDKVQRVKNKWKCVLKDGVLKANGKEYLFHKATGEFEW